MISRLGCQGYDESKLRRSVKHILRESVLCSLATVNGNGIAHINTAYFAFDPDFRIYFKSDPATQHSRNLVKNPTSAISVFSTSQPWGKSPLRGLQLFGSTKRATGTMKASADHCYRSRFPEYTKWISQLDAEELDALKAEYYVFTTRSLTLLDEKRFGEEVFVRVRISRKAKSVNVS